MDHLSEAKKFIQRAQNASHKEVIVQHLVMADWYLSEAIKERDGAADAQKADQPDSGPKTASARLG
jgi:hypothetical protein